MSYRHADNPQLCIDCTPFNIKYSLEFWENERTAWDVNCLKPFFFRSIRYSTSPYLTLMRSSFSSIGSAANHRKMKVAAA